jgi:hypothetical protein
MTASHKSSFKPAEMIICALFIITPVVYSARYGGGNGLEYPYQIWTAEQLNTIGAHPEDWWADFVLMADIDMSSYTGTQFNIIGNYSTTFNGEFDGKGHVIRNLSYSKTNGSVEYCGLFGKTRQARISNLRLENVNISVKGMYAGGLVAFLQKGGIENCQVTGTISSDYSNSTGNINVIVGGLAGAILDTGSITNCISQVSISSSSTMNSLHAGGLAGSNAGTIANCLNLGLVSSSFFASPTTTILRESYAGGLVGWNTGTLSNCVSSGSVLSTVTTWCILYAGGLVGRIDGGALSNCYCTGSVDGSSFLGPQCHVGGIAAYQNGGSITNCYSMAPVVISPSSDYSRIGGAVGYQYQYGTIINCYSVGSVTVYGGEMFSTSIGGFLGSKMSFTNPGGVKSCFWDTQTSGCATSSGGTGVTGLTTAEMKSLTPFTGKDWDFTSSDGDPAEWKMIRESQDYPRLAWQPLIPGDTAGLYGVDLEDLLYLVGRWTAGTPATVGAADVDGSGKVDLMDMAILSENWGK